MAASKRKSRYFKEFAAWVFCLGISAAAAWFIFPQFRPAFALVANDGTLVYSDNTASSTKWRTLTNPSTFGAETSDGLGLAADADQIVVKASPTRDEKMVGYLFDDGTLRIRRCTGGCDASGDWTTQWTKTLATASGRTDKRAFDIIYESRTGDALVVFTDSIEAGSVYYCHWDGSVWTPSSTCGSSASAGLDNQISLNDGTTSLAGLPWRVNLKAMSDNRAWLQVEDENADLYVIEWNGSTWDTSTDLVATQSLSCDDNAGTNVDAGQCFTIEEESLSGTAILFYTTGTPLIYRTFNGSWSSETTGATLAGAGNWLHATADPLSDRVALINGDQGSDVRTYMWKANGSTAGLTAGQFDTTAESMIGDNVDVDWERGVGQATRTALYVYTDANGLVTRYSVTTCTGSGCTFGAFASATGNCIDDCDRQLLVASPNGDEMMNLKGDIDSGLKAQRWNGSGWDTISADLTTAGALADGTTNANHVQMSFDFAYKPYSPWLRNWRFYQNTDAVQPTTDLAAENTAPTGITPTQQLRLRVQFEERSGQGQSGTTARKRLQYVSSSTCPAVDSCANSNWTNVDSQGGAGIWRHFNNATPADDAAITSSLLTTTGCSATQLGRYYEQSATTTAFINSSLNCAEHDYTVEFNGTKNGLTYYFRMYDEDQAKPVRRLQLSGTGQCAGSSACTYPSLTIAPPGPTTDDIMRHGSWFSSGVEQSFFWAD